MERPIISIIIPTKNRYSYLKCLIQLLVSYQKHEMEIVIQDNSDDNSSFIDFLDTIKYDNLKYHYCSSALSVIENSNLAVNHSSGEYVCFIGDDDGVMPRIADFALWMKVNNIDSAITNRPNYYWPDIIHKLHDFSGSLSYFRFTNKVKYLDPMKELDTCLKKGGSSLENMPRLYHGIVSRKCLDKLYIMCSSYFPGPSPDMANAVALSTFVEKHVYFDYPLIIAGVGFSSTGGAGVRKNHIGKLEDISFLPKDTIANWETGIPKIWTGQTIWAESAIKALRVTNNEVFLRKFNYNYLYASFFVFHIRLIRNYFQFVRGFFSIFQIMYYMFLIVLLRGKFFVLNMFSRKFASFNFNTVYGVDDIRSCILQLELILNSQYSDRFISD